MLALAFSIAVLSIAIPVAMVWTIPDSGRSQGWVVTLVITVWSGLRLSAIWVRGRPRLFDFFFWLFTYIFMGIAATSSLRADEVPYTTPGVDPAFDVPTALIVLGGLLAYELGAFGYWVSRRKAREAVLSDIGISSGRAGLLYLVGLAVAAYYVAKMGLSAIFSSRTSAGLAQSYAWPDSSVFSVIYALAIYPLLVSIGAFSQNLRARTGTGAGRFGYGLLVLGGFAMLMLVANPLSSARYTAGTVAFALVMFAGAATTERKARLTMMGTIVGFLFVFPLLNVFRYDNSEVGARQTFFSEYIGNPDYDAFFQVANAYSFVVDGLVVPMRQLLGSLLFWVPRSVWPGKPEDTGIMLADYRGYNFGNLSAPMWAELLVDGGVIAVLIGFVIIGAVLAALDFRMVRAHAQGGWWGLAGSILSVYSLILWRGSLLQATGALAVMVTGMLWVRRKSPPRSVLPTPRR